jgi:hypothetical protein
MGAEKQGDPCCANPTKTLRGSIPAKKHDTIK